MPKILVKHHKRRVALIHLPFYNMAKEKKFLEIKLIKIIKLIFLIDLIDTLRDL
jgi:hypothetical protein